MQSGPEQLKDWMRRRGFTQADAARYLELPSPTVCLILKGKDQLGLRRAICVERLTGIPVEAWASQVDDDAELESADAANAKIAKG